SRMDDYATRLQLGNGRPVKGVGSQESIAGNRFIQAVHALIASDDVDKGATSVGFPTTPHNGQHVVVDSGVGPRIAVSPVGDTSGDLHRFPNRLDLAIPVPRVDY